MGSVVKMPMLPQATKRTRSRKQAAKAGPSYIPSDKEIMEITKAQTGEYEMSDREAKTVRSRIYSINKHNLAGMRFRTLREGRLLMIWRIK